MTEIDGADRTESLPRGAHIAVIGAQPEWIAGLRGPMIRDFLARGYRVTAIAANDHAPSREKIESWGAQYRVVPLQRAGLNPLNDLAAIRAMTGLLRELRCDAVFAFTMKPIIYGTVAAWLARVPRRYAMIAGRGYALLPGNEAKRRVAGMVLTHMLRQSLRFASGVIFQNTQDRDFFLERGIIASTTRTTRVNGSGVDLDHYTPTGLPYGATRFLMVARLLEDKGVRQFVGAARNLRGEFPDAEFTIVGAADPSPNGVPLDEVKQWHAEGIVDYRGSVPDTRVEIAKAHVMVLPTFYGEGVPRSLLEGMAMERGIITTDAPGCADTVEEGVNGFVVPMRDTEQLTAAMRRFASDRAFTQKAGRESGRIATERFDAHKVNAAIARFMGLGARDDAVA